MWMKRLEVAVGSADVARHRSRASGADAGSVCWWPRGISGLCAASPVGPPVRTYGATVRPSTYTAQTSAGSTEFAKLDMARSEAIRSLRDHSAGSATEARCNDRLLTSGSATDQTFSPVAGVLLVKIRLVHLEAGHVQCLGERHVARLPCILCCRADALNPIPKLSQISRLSCRHADTLSTWPGRPCRVLRVVTST